MGKLLLTEILNNYWLIDKERAMGYKALFASLINGETISVSDNAEKRLRNKSFVVGAANKVFRYALTDTDIPANSTAIIPIRGEIMKYDQACGPRGTMSIIDDIKQANANPNIGSILLVVDSPGGMVTHTDLLADAVATSKIPVISFIEGMAASAAYWIISGSAKVIASSDIDRIGSIGTMLAFADVQPYYEEMGIVFHEFYASKSTDKNKDFNNILEGKYDDYRENVLDVINDKFHASVKNNRPNLDEKTLTGKVFFAKDAIVMGLIDEIGSFDYALEEAAKFGSEITIQNTHKTNETMKVKATWKAILSFFNMDSTKENELTEESVEKMNEELQSRADIIGRLQTDLEAANEAKAAAENLLAAQQAETARVQKEFDDFKAQDAADETRAQKEKDDFAAQQAAFDQADYNKMADNL